MDSAELRWMAITAVAIGVAVGMLAFRWKRRSTTVWTIYGMLTFGAAVVILALLPRLERRKLLPERERNWHR